jgi:hypothetical protein
MSESSDDVDAYGCELLVREGRTQVVLREEASKEFWSLEQRAQAKLLVRCKLWAAGKKLSEEHLNHNEGRARKGDINRRIEAFKISGVRLFGFVRPLMGFKTFVAVAVDAAKKQRKANPRVLSRAVARIVKFEEQFGGNV